MKEKGRGWRWGGKKVGFKGQKGREGDGTPGSHPQGGGDERFPRPPGADKLIQVLHMCEGLYISMSCS